MLFRRTGSVLGNCACRKLRFLVIVFELWGSSRKKLIRKIKSNVTQSSSIDDMLTFLGSSSRFEGDA
jgi:hypothetical protein